MCDASSRLAEFNSITLPCCTFIKVDFTIIGTKKKMPIFSKRTVRNFVVIPLFKIKILIVG